MGVCVCSDGSTGGHWSALERDWHINALELMAAFLVVQSFCKPLTYCHVQIQIDNTVAVAYINNMGGKTWQCNDIARQLWLWCIERHIVLEATYIPGKCNIEADRQSRLKHGNAEWMLHRTLFSSL